MCSHTNITPIPQWYNHPNWFYRKLVTINPTNDKVSGSQSNFPVLINLASDPDLSADARSDGNDILFTSFDGVTKLSHEIELFTKGSGALVAWVNVPNLIAGDHTVLYLYYGNASSSDQQDPTGVWDANYKAVWHLSEPGTGARRDSTTNNNRANTRNYDGDEASTGKIGGADYLDRTADHLESANNIGIVGNAVRTITFWAKLDDADRCGMVGWGTNDTGAQFRTAIRDNHYFLWAYGLGNDWDTGVIPATANWFHHAITYDGTTARWYVNGSEIGSGFAFTYDTRNSHVFIGIEEDGATTSYMKGSIDEIRISNIARTPDWIQTEYNNQGNPSTFYSLGTEESFCP
jgi:hypothetical protein